MGIEGLDRIRITPTSAPTDLSEALHWSLRQSAEVQPGTAQVAPEYYAQCTALVSATLSKRGSTENFRDRYKLIDDIVNLIAKGDPELKDGRNKAFEYVNLLARQEKSFALIRILERGITQNTLHPTWVHFCIEQLRDLAVGREIAAANFMQRMGFNPEDEPNEANKKIMQHIWYGQGFKDTRDLVLEFTARQEYFQVALTNNYHIADLVISSRNASRMAVLVSSDCSPAVEGYQQKACRQLRAMISVWRPKEGSEAQEDPMRNLGIVTARLLATLHPNGWYWRQIADGLFDRVIDRDNQVTLEDPVIKSVIGKFTSDRKIGQESRKRFVAAIAAKANETARWHGINIDTPVILLRLRAAVERHIVKGKSD